MPPLHRLSPIFRPKRRKNEMHVCAPIISARRLIGYVSFGPRRRHFPQRGSLYFLPEFPTFSPTHSGNDPNANVLE